MQPTDEDIQEESLEHSREFATLVEEFRREGYTTSEACELIACRTKNTTSQLEKDAPVKGGIELGASSLALMDTKKKVKRGGSKVKRLGSRKPKFHGRPYQTIEDEPRIFMAVARISESTSKSLHEMFSKNDKVNTAGVLAAIGIIYDRKTTESEQFIQYLINAVPKKSLQEEENLV